MYKCIKCGAIYNGIDGIQNLFKCRVCESKIYELKQSSKDFNPVEPTVDRTEEVRGNGGSTSYYELPEGATELKHLIKHKKMEHGIGEAFCALYRLNDNGEYKRNLIKAKFYIENELEYYDKNK